MIWYDIPGNGTLSKYLMEYAYQLNLPPIKEILRPEFRDNPWKDIDGLVTVTDAEEFVDPSWLHFKELNWYKANIFKKAPGWYGPIHTDGDNTVQTWAINWVDSVGGGMEFWHPDAIESSSLEYDVGGRTDGRVKGWRHVVSRPADFVYITPPNTAWLIDVTVPHNGFNPASSTQTRWVFSLRTNIGDKPDTFKDAVAYFSDLIINK